MLVSRDFLNKILLGLGAIFLFGTLIFVIVKQVEISKRQEAIETQVTSQKQLADNIMRAQQSWATKQDIEVMAKNNGVDLSVIKSDLSKLNAQVAGINVVTTNSVGQSATNVASTGTQKGGPGPSTIECTGTTVTCPDPFGYLSNQQTLQLNEQFAEVKVPIGQVGFSTWKDHPWDVTINPRSYVMTTVVGKNDEGKEYVYNKLQIKSDDKTYDVKIGSSTFLQEYPDPKFSFWNPRLFLGVSGGLNVSDTKADFAPQLSVALMSYGQYRIQPSWTFLGLGAGWAFEAKKFNFLITPFSYNVGQHIPLTRNIYIGPSVGFDTSGNVSLFGTLNVGL